MMITLHEIHRAIDARVQSIRDNHPDWQCSKGCDTCCRQLADIPRLSGAEWMLLREGLAALPAEAVLARMIDDYGDLRARIRGACGR